MNLITHLEALHRNEDGATATEYVILLVLIACVIIALVKTFGETLNHKYQSADQLVLKEVVF
jgi:pilus assembly protein Flp/PilA